MRDMTKSANPDLARSCTDLVLLTLLQQEPMYGYQILTTLQDRGNGEFRFKQGTLYPVLYRMEREGWIEANWEDPPEGKRRKVYRVTAAGCKEHAKRASQWLRFNDAVRSILQEAGHV